MMDKKWHEHYFKDEELLPRQMHLPEPDKRRRTRDWEEWEGREAVRNQLVMMSF